MDKKHPRNSQASAPCHRLNVAVLMGGIGQERQVSLQSGGCVAEALQRAGVSVLTCDITPTDMSVLGKADIDVFFLALHGEFGEDGHLQGILEDKELVYTGSGPEASRLAFDKLASKRLFAEAGVKVPAAVEFEPNGDLGLLEEQLSQLGERFVVKPVRQGSSVGVSIIHDVSEAMEAAQRTFEQFGDCMIEQFIEGREITVGILGGEALPVIEIRSKTGFYDYHAKYVDYRTEYLFDTVGERAVVREINKSALRCFNALGCKDFARVDFILSQDGVPYALEVNTIPGFTTHSLLPKAAAKIGLSMSDLCLRIVESASAGAGRDRRQGSGVRGQGSEARRQKTEDRSCQAELI